VTTLIRSHEYGDGNIHGNCGIRIAYRLLATYTTEEESSKRYKELLDRGQLSRILTPRHASPITAMLHSIKRAEGGRAVARAYPVEWAFAELLEVLHYGSYALICMTDTEDGLGDGHKGEYATRNFAAWLLDNGVVQGNCTTGIRYPDDPVSTREVYGWFFVPDKPRINALIAKVKREICQYIKDCNNDPEIAKQAEKKKTEAEVTKEALERGYEGFSLGEEPNPLFTYIATSDVDLLRVPQFAAPTAASTTTSDLERIEELGSRLGNLDDDESDELEYLLDQQANEEEYYDE